MSGRIALAALAMLLATACTTTPAVILGGAPAPAALQPWTVAFVDPGCQTGTVVCGGTLIAPGWVLTAAHCICDAGIAAGSTVGIGDATSDCAMTFQVAEVFPHPDFHRSGAAANDSDIALVRLQSIPASGTLPALGTDPSAGAPVLFAGRGIDESGDDSITLEAVLLNVADDAICEQAFGSEFTRNMHCASGTNQGICGGDSGGPVLVQSNGAWTVIGVASFGGCNAPSGVSVFTRVAPFTDWLHQTIAGNAPAAICR